MHNRQICRNFTVTNQPNIKPTHESKANTGRHSHARRSYISISKITRHRHQPAARQRLPDGLLHLPAQHLFYAWSTDGLNWQQANGGKPVFTAYDESIWMRDPYLNRVTRNGKDTFHLVHTWGWDNPAIFHWQSDDLIHWTAADGGTTTDSGKIYVMDGKDGRPESPNAWAPEFTYVPEEDTFYIYWSSRIDDRQRHYVTTTRDWKTFTTPRPLFDPGFTAIDLTVVRQGDTFYGYYKDERNGEKTILAATTSNLDPAVDTFGDTPVRVLPKDYGIEVEGPPCSAPSEVTATSATTTNSSATQACHTYAAPTFRKATGRLIPDTEVTNVPEVKHGSVTIISRDELLPSSNRTVRQ